MSPVLFLRLLFFRRTGGIGRTGDLPAADALTVPHALRAEALRQNIGFLFRKLAACDNDDVDADRHLQLCGRICRTNDALGTVPLYSIADLLTGGNAEAIIRKPVWADIDQRSAERTKRTLAVKPLKIRVIVQLLRKQHNDRLQAASKSHRKKKESHKRVAALFLRIGSIGQSCATLCTAASQNLTTIRGCHTLPEAVLHLAVPLLRLICSLHGNRHSFSFVASDIRSDGAANVKNYRISAVSCKYNTPCEV